MSSRKHESLMSLSQARDIVRKQQSEIDDLRARVTELEQQSTPRETLPSIPDPHTDEFKRLVKEVIADPDPENAISLLAGMMETRVVATRGGSRELRRQRDWLIREMIMIHRFIDDHLPQPVRYEGEDPAVADVTFISYSVSFSDVYGNFRNIKDSTGYPAPFDEAIGEVMPQFFFAANYIPLSADTGQREVPGISPSDLRSMLCDLAQYRRLDPERYKDRQKDLFDQSWLEIEEAMQAQGIAYSDTADAYRNAWLNFKRYTDTAINNLEERLRKHKLGEDRLVRKRTEF